MNQLYVYLYLVETCSAVTLQKSVYSGMGRIRDHLPNSEKTAVEHSVARVSAPKTGSAIHSFITQERWPNHSETRSTHLESKYSCFENLLMSFIYYLVQCLA